MASGSGCIFACPNPTYLNHRLVLTVCMRAFLFLFVLALLSNPAHLWAQGVKNGGKSGKTFRFAPNITPKDYERGRVFLKALPGQKPVLDQMGSSRGARESNPVLSQLGVHFLSPIVSGKAVQLQNQRRARPATVDVSLFYEVRFNPQIPVEEAINALYQLNIAEYIEPAYIYHSYYTPNDPELARQYYLSIIKASAGWAKTKGSAQVVVGVVDSGIDTQHPDIRDKFAINTGEIPDNNIDDDEDGFIDNIIGWDFVGSDPNRFIGDNNPHEGPPMTFSHGTEVAGIAVAHTDNGIGIAGVGFNTRLIVTKHHPENDPSETSVYGTFLGVLYMANRNVDVINCSFGGPGRSQLFQDIITYATLDQGCLVVAAAGNEGGSSTNYPEGYDYVLSVTATDRDNLVPSFADRKSSVDLCAPGVGLYTTGISGTYKNSTGTSFSTPIVSGAAALLKSFYPNLTGYQIGELLRVTANGSVYTTNPQISFDLRFLGKGLLDIEKAFNTRPPSIRAENVRIVNAAGQPPQPGDRDVVLTADFRNYLWNSRLPVEVTLSSPGTFSTVQNATITLPPLDSGQVINNRLTPFRVNISNFVPENTMETFRLSFRAGDYEDYQFVELLLNPSYLNIQKNLVSTTVASNGRLGFRDTEQQQGIGFLYNDQNLLYEMGLMMGNSNLRLVSNVRAENRQYHDDFFPTSRIREQTPGSRSFSEVFGNFDDRRAPASRQVRVETSYRSMVWIESPDDRYIIMEYKIRNIGEQPIENFFAGLYADWDITENGASDIAEWNQALKLGYIHSFDPNARTYAGIQLLTGTPNYWAIDNDERIPGNPFGVYDGFSLSEKFRTLSNGIGRAEAGKTVTGGTDVSHTVGAGPYNIPVGDSITVAFALHAAITLEDLLASARAADRMYNQVFNAPRPTAPAVEVCFGSPATLRASGAVNYRWYRSSAGGEPIGTGPTFTTPEPVTENRVFYVSNADGAFESLRTPVPVLARANPNITISGTTNLCPGDSVLLSAEEADEYLWSNGARTRSIVVREAGQFWVQVTHRGLNCINRTADLVRVTRGEGPTANFTVNQQGDVELAFQPEVQFTDQSQNAVAWFWDFDDGNTSTERNPRYRFRVVKNHAVRLTVLSANGCAATATRNLNVVTSIEKEQLLSGVALYPNPAATRFSLLVENDYHGDLWYELLSISGQVAQRGTLRKMGKTLSTEIDVSMLSPGMYLLHIGNQSEKAVLKLVRN